MEKLTIQVGADRRSYRYIAPTEPKPGAPLLLALHGTTQTGAAMRRFSGRTLDALAGTVGADLVYLDGYRRAWNDGRITKTSAAQKKDIDDVAFIRAVIDLFDRPAVVIGYSNGGQMLHRFIRETRGHLSGAVFIAAGLPVSEDFALNDTAPDEVPVLLLQGTGDKVMPADGGATSLFGSARGPIRSALDTAAAYAGGAEPTVTRSATSTRYDWARVRLITQTGAGHVIPNRRTAPPIVGPSHHDIDTGEEIRDFLAL
ncbi:hypothetical protein NE857_12160 [Nocardiopsis exhalans]|uniref:Polyhydroxybutyrate depolymerase n=1 Tax=Nocardiopsis exhalans TaxID=163604 RepID=A0ABY5DGW4_9ACTN|nr:hypothetical protein [Nocardiopsis exhalans]USY22288.1 hypothetical protein NE857_12160 [Nocardiopsis exhalans]